jgi:hypothetical protein
MPDAKLELSANRTDNWDTQDIVDIAGQLSYKYYDDDDDNAGNSGGNESGSESEGDSL